MEMDDCQSSVALDLVIAKPERLYEDSMTRASAINACAATAGNIAAGADLTLVALIQPVRS